MNARWTPHLLSAPAAAILLGLLACPLVLLARVSMYEPGRGIGNFAPGSWTVENFALIRDGYYLSILGFTVRFGIEVAALTVAVAFPLALFVRSLSTRWRGIALACILLPKLASVLVILFGLQQILGSEGIVNRALLALGIVAEPIRLVRNHFGAVVGEASLIVPYSVLVLATQMLGIDPTLEAAARGLGASPWRVFQRVTLPLSIPGLLLATQLGLMWGMGAFLGPILLGGPHQATLSTEAHRQAFEYGNWPRAAATTILLVATVGACLAFYTLATRRWRNAP